MRRVFGVVLLQLYVLGELHVMFPLTSRLKTGQ